MQSVINHLTSPTLLSGVSQCRRPSSPALPQHDPSSRDTPAETDCVCPTPGLPHCCHSSPRCSNATDTVKVSADAAAREQLAKVVEVLVGDKVASFDDCIAWARLKFQVGGGAWL